MNFEKCDYVKLLNNYFDLLEDSRSSMFKTGYQSDFNLNIFTNVYNMGIQKFVPYFTDIIKATMTSKLINEKKR